MVLEKQVILFLNIAHSGVKQIISDVFRKGGFQLSPEQFLVMDTLWDEGVLTQQQIADITMRDKNSIVKQDWVPKAPVYMLHSMDDDTVDFINAMHARATWPDANIVYNFGHYGGHVPAALRFIYTVKTLLVEEELGL